MGDFEDLLNDADATLLVGIDDLLNVGDLKAWHGTHKPTGFFRCPTALVQDNRRTRGLKFIVHAIYTAKVFKAKDVPVIGNGFIQVLDVDENSSRRIKKWFAHRELLITPLLLPGP